MHRFAIHDRFERIAIAALLAMALLCAQAAGLRHAIGHAGLHAATVHQDDGAGFEHSCELVEAAALAPGLPTPCYSPAMLPGGPVLALWLAFASWHAPLSLAFSSRAPPRG
jgi:hypothetical protein